MFYWDSSQELTQYYIQKMLMKFQTSVLPKLMKRQDYYDGQQLILSKTYNDESQKANNIVTNYCKNIVNSYTGFMVGQPITYNGEDIQDIIDILRYNDYREQDNQMLHSALVYGVSAELVYIDEDKKIRFNNINPCQCFGIFSNDCEERLLYFVRWYRKNYWDDNEIFTLEIYDDRDIRVYEMLGIGGGLTLKDTRPHYFSQCPANIFYLQNEEGISDCVFSLQDAYNEALSCDIDGLSYFSDAYLVMQGCSIPGETETEKATNAQTMRKNRLFELPYDNCSMSFLTKPSNDANSENVLTRIEKSIYRIAQCPDFSDESFGNSSSGISLQYKLCNIDNRASSIENRMIRSLQRRIELLCSFVGMLTGEDVWRDISIEFHHNIPNDINEIATLVNTLNGVVSDDTLLAQIPFVTNIEEEKQKIAEKRQNNMDLFRLDWQEDKEEEPEQEENEEK